MLKVTWMQWRLKLNAQATQWKSKQVFMVINRFLLTMFTFDYSFKEQDLCSQTPVNSIEQKL